MAEKEKISAESPIGAFGILLLLLLIIAVPLSIAIWEIGTPVKGFSGFSQKA